MQKKNCADANKALAQMQKSEINNPKRGVTNCENSVPLIFFNTVKFTEWFQLIISTSAWILSIPHLPLASSPLLVLKILKISRESGLQIDYESYTASPTTCILTSPSPCPHPNHLLFSFSSWVPSCLCFVLQWWFALKKPALHKEKWNSRGGKQGWPSVGVVLSQ